MSIRGKNRQDVEPVCRDEDHQRNRDDSPAASAQSEESLTPHVPGERAQSPAENEPEDSESEHESALAGFPGSVVFRISVRTTTG